MSGKNRKSNTSNAPKLAEDLANFLKTNKLDVFANRFQSEGIFTLDDFTLLTPDDIEQIKKSVDGVGYRNRLGHAYSKVRPNSEQKDEESDPEPVKVKRTSKQQQRAPQRVVQPKKQRKVPSRPPPPPMDDGPNFVIYFLVISLALVLLAAAILLETELQKVSKQAGLSKKYPGRKIWKNMDAFFKFYMTQHTDTTSQLLHVAGTLITALITLFNPSLLLSQITGICAGLVARPFCNGFSSGIVEGLVAMFAGQLTAFSLNQWRKLMFCILIGYGLAWIGHFQFEKNTPATFQAPMYSLLSDFLLATNYVREAVLTKKFPLEKALTAATCVIKPATFGPILKNLRSIIPK